jgi:hypothetical protein
LNIAADGWFEKQTPVLDTLLTEAEQVGFEPTVRVAQKDACLGVSLVVSQLRLLILPPP